MARFERTLVTPETGAGGGEQGDIAGAADPYRLRAFVPDLVIPDEPLNNLGHDARFVFPYAIAIEPAVVVLVRVIDRNFETGDGRAFGRSRAGCRQARKPGLPGR